MKMRVLVHGIWIVLAAGAYIAGTFHPRAGSSAAHARASGAVGSARPGAPPVVVGNASARGAAVDASAELGRWVDGFRGTNGMISAERMQEAMEAAIRDPDPVRATLYFAQLLKELTAENAPAALKAVTENMSGPDGMRFLGLLAHAWGEKDGAAALAAFDALRGREGELARSTAMAGWAARDPDAAMKWLQDRPSHKDPKADPRIDSPLSRGVVAGLARRDVDTALKYLMTLNENQQVDFVGLLADQKMKEGIPLGAEWAEALPNERMRTTALEVVGMQYLRRDLDGAVAWAEKIASRPTSHEAVADIANEMAGRNGQEAAEWVAKLPPGESQDHAFEDVFERWTRTDPTAASQSLGRLEPGPGRDSAIQAFSRTLARENPGDALTWAGAMSDEKARTNVQVDIARRWQATAPADAQAWIAANLPPDVQARVLGPVRR